MMTDGDVSAHERAEDADASLDQNLAGHGAIVELLRAQEDVAPRSSLARLFGMSPLTPATHAMYRGVVGELEVGEALGRLGPEWTVLHALPVEAGSADIDHLVIGPAGVFIVSTKNHAGLNIWASQRTFMVSGMRYPHIRNIEYEMGKAERMLTSAAGGHIEVGGILAIVAPKTLVVREKHRDVAVLASTHLVTWLLRHRRTLSPAEVSHISTAASLASTWFPTDVEPVQPASVRERFELLRAEVRAAWRTQLTWAVGVSALGVGAFGVITYTILLNALGSFGR
jgi:hypothetical protein